MYIYIYIYINIYIYIYVSNVYRCLSSQKERQCALLVITNTPMTSW